MERPLHVYQASAGSGKTYTLVREYLRLALQAPDRWQEILALTFTNKATAELKTRILRDLQALALERPSHQQLAHDLTGALQDDLAAAYGPTASRGVSVGRAADALLRRMLHNYGRFGVQTLDAFFVRVVRAFLYELNSHLRRSSRIHPGVRFEIRTQRAYRHAIDDVLSAIGTDRELTEWLARRMSETLEAEDGWQVERELSSLVRYVLDPTFAQHFPDGPPTFEAWADTVAHLRQAQTRLTAELTTGAQALLEALKNTGIELTRFNKGNSPLPRYLAEVAAGHLTALTPSALGIASPEQWAGKSKPEVRAALEAGLFAHYQDFVARYTAHLPILTGLAEVLANAGLLPIVRHLAQALTDYRSREQVLFLHDAQRLLSDIVAETQVPFLYEKVGSRYPHLLLDEFQDTSTYQWHNLRPLLDNGLTSGERSALVGDVKQAIYRFRGGSVELMGQVVTDYARHVAQTPLTTNYRSGGEVIAFVNDWFDLAVPVLQRHLTGAAQALLASAYDPATRHQTARPGRETQGYVALTWLAPATQDEELAPALGYALSRVQALLAEGYRGTDLALLVRTNDQSRALAEALTRAGIAFSASESLQLPQSPAVQHVRSALCWLLNPADALAAAHLRAQAYAQRTPTATLGYGALDHPLPPVLVKQRAWLLGQPLVTTLQSVCTYLGYTPSRDAFLLRLLDLAVEVSDRRGGIAELVATLDDPADDPLAVEAPPDTHAVRILTVHKAKGLEFPVVILPFLDRSWNLLPSGKHASTLWARSGTKPFADVPFALPARATPTPEETNPFYPAQSEELWREVLDNLNLLYVAFTRAADRLYLASSWQPPTSGDDPLRLPKSAGELLYRVATAAGWGTTPGKGMARGTGAPPNPHDRPTAPTQPLPARAAAPDALARVEIRRRARELSALLAPAHERSAALVRGQQVHALLAQVRAVGDMPAALAAGRHAGWLTAAEAPELETLLHSIAEHPELAPAFAPGATVLTEASLLLPGKGTQRPDRIALTAEATWVLEYKTGLPHPSHREQLAQYLHLIAQAELPPARGYLVYLHQPLTVLAVS